MKKRLLSALLAAAMLFSLAACGAPAAEETPAAPDAPAADAPASDVTENAYEVQYPVTLTDQLGREVTIEEAPETIVSGYYISTSALMALGQTDKLVGIEAKADSRPIYAAAAPELLELPSVGTAKEFDLETCASLDPDLVVVPAKLKKTIPAMEELGLTVLAVNPEDAALLHEAITLLGTATNSMERAEALFAFNESTLADLFSRLEGKEAPTVYLASNSALLSCATSGMYQNTLIEQAGGVNVAAELEEDYWAEISYEQLLAWDPAYIILAGDAKYTVQDVLNDPALANASAVQNGKVFKFPSNFEALDSPVPGSSLGAVWLAGVLHGDTAFESASDAFYREFYGVSPQDAV